MDALGLVASIALGGLFLLAGASKIAAATAWPRQALDLGAPAFVIPLVPWAEIAVGALLVSQLAPVVVAGVAIVILVAFTVLIGGQLARGRRPPCACFGAWSATPIGPWHIARNVGMIALAVITIAAA